MQGLRSRSATAPRVPVLSSSSGRQHTLQISHSLLKASRSPDYLFLSSRMESAGSDKFDDLEIASIGTIYRGPWEKKYWSCSRVFALSLPLPPFPVYCRRLMIAAVMKFEEAACFDRVKNVTHIRWVMLLSEHMQAMFIGWKYVKVTADDGSSFNGQTPEIAWENFQKNSLKRKNWPGKRFPNKIDVQRLLREIMANVDVKEGKKLLSPSKAMHMDQQMHHGMVEREQRFERRSLRKRDNNQGIIREERFKKVCCHQGFRNDSNTSISQKVGDSCFLFQNSDAVGTEGTHLSCSHSEDSPSEVVSNHCSPSSKCGSPSIRDEDNTVSYENYYRNEEPCPMKEMKTQLSYHYMLDGNKTRMGLDCSDCIVDKHVVSQQKSDDMGNENHRLTGDLKKGYDIGMILPDSRPDSEKVHSNPASEALFVDNGQLIALGRFSDVSISNTSNTLVGCNEFSALEHSKESHVCMKNEHVGVKSLSTVPMTTPEVASKDDTIILEVAKDSLPEVGLSSCSSGRSLDDVDIDLAGQELTKSMMAFLLPQAVPLLKKTYFRKRSRHRLREPSCEAFAVSGLNSAVQNAASGINNIMHQDEQVTGKFAHVVESKIQEVIGAPKTSLDTSFFQEVARIEPTFNTYLCNERFSGNGCSRDVKSVIPDSLDSDQCSYGASMKSHACNVHYDPNPSPAIQMNWDSDNAGNADTINLPINVGVIELSNCISQNNACNSEVLNANTISQISLNNSFPALAQLKDTPLVGLGNSSKHLIEHLSLDADCVMQSSSHLLRFECEQHPRKDPVTAENFVQNFPAFCTTINSLNDKKISQVVSESHEGSESSKIHGNHNPIEIVRIDTHESKGGDAKSEKSNHSLSCLPGEVMRKGEFLLDTVEAQNSELSPYSSAKYNAPFSESIICRNTNNANDSEINFAGKLFLTDENDKFSFTACHVRLNMLPGEVEPTVQEGNLNKRLHSTESEGNNLISAVLPSMNQYEDKTAVAIKELLDHANHSFCIIENSVDSFNQPFIPGKCSLPEVKNQIEQIPYNDKNHAPCHQMSSYENSLMQPLLCVGGNPLMQSTIKDGQKYPELYERNHFDVSAEMVRLSKEGSRLMELVGCYLHPEPVLFMTITSRGSKERFSFFYGLHITSASFERSALQLAPDGQSLIFLSSIKVPRCSEHIFDCLCASCKSESSEETTLEIVHVKHGYVSTVARLTARERITCLAVCEPTYIVAAEDKGELHVWVMNCTWR
ncbi:hypothetical protein AXF42_Ash002363 [Apostasia shenzhenica]|uniref:Uncharacterized protein n=1 Tax=Apostasia shenzhenica TaxID=1088818 RepID=A0A2I0ANB6_9ASPA|nr:hypothetical protein AXF42_Ash002363 [Apostasia shenzhenica]